MKSEWKHETRKCPDCTGYGGCAYGACLPERFGDAMAGEPMGFREHPDWKRNPSGRSLVHKPTGATYHGTMDGKPVWTLMYEYEGVSFS